MTQVDLDIKIGDIRLCTINSYPDGPEASPVEIVDYEMKDDGHVIYTTKLLETGEIDERRFGGYWLRHLVRRAEYEVCD